jgi:hypothetical protein
MSFTFSENDVEKMIRSSTAPLGKRIQLSIIAERISESHSVLFTLDRPLPGESATSNYFRYGGHTIVNKGVKNPKVDLCDSLPVRSFINDFEGVEGIELLTFLLIQVEVRYSGRVSYERTIQLFVNACAKALDISDGDSILVQKVLL